MSRRATDQEAQGKNKTPRMTLDAPFPYGIAAEHAARKRLASDLRRVHSRMIPPKRNAIDHELDREVSKLCVRMGVVFTIICLLLGYVVFR